MPAKNREREVALGSDNYASRVSQAKNKGVEISLVSQIQSARLKDEKKPGEKREGLVDIWFWTGDGSGYGLKGDDIVFYHTDAANNPGLENPEEFRRQLTGSDYAFFLDAGKSSTLEAKANYTNDNSVAAFNLSELKREGILKEYEHGNKSVYVEVSTDVLMQGKKAFRKKYGDKVTDLFDTVHGEAIYGKNGIGAKLKQKGEEATRVCFLNPDHVGEKLRQKAEGTTLWQDSRLGSFGLSSNVVFHGVDIDYNGRRLWAVVREAGDAERRHSPNE